MNLNVGYSKHSLPTGSIIFPKEISDSKWKKEAKKERDFNRF